MQHRHDSVCQHWSPLDPPPSPRPWCSATPWSGSRYPRSPAQSPRQWLCMHNFTFTGLFSYLLKKEIKKSTTSDIKIQNIVSLALLAHPYTQARICCNSNAECIGYTQGPNWACPGISVSQSEESFTIEKVTFNKPLYVYTVCEPIGGVV